MQGGKWKIEVSNSIIKLGAYRLWILCLVAAITVPAAMCFKLHVNCDIRWYTKQRMNAFVIPEPQTTPAKLLLPTRRELLTPSKSSAPPP